MQNYANGPEIPIGLGMAMAQNVEAMSYFSTLTNEGKQRIIDHTHSIKSKGEMQSFVNSMFKPL